MLFGTLLTYILILSFTVGCSGLMIKMTPADLWSNADVVLIGEVTSITTHEGSRATIYKDVEVRVEKYFKNPLNASKVVIRVLGGEIGDRGVWVEDQPSFHKNERVLVYLHKYSEDSFYGIEGYYVVGGPQGKFTITFGIAKSEVGETLILTEHLGKAATSIDMKIISSIGIVGAIALVIYYRKLR